MSIQIHYLVIGLQHILYTPREHSCRVMCKYCGDIRARNKSESETNLPSKLNCDKKNQTNKQPFH